MHFYTIMFFISCIIVSSCTTYDEEDTTIIGFLKINDLIENKISPICKAEIEKVGKDIDEYNESIDNRNFSRFFNLGLPTPVKELDYDVDQINQFTQKYKNEEGYYDLNKLEMGITTELWSYINQTYADVIPAKAQNGQEGKYYTISELKKKYPDYNKVELEDFRPMELLKKVENEKIFGPSLLSEGDINLRTLYIFYVYYKQLEEQNKSQTGNSTNSDIDYKGLIKKHCNTIPENADEIIEKFNELSTNGKSYYKHDEEGFNNFLFDYFETDIFSGADVE